MANDEAQLRQFIAEELPNIPEGVRENWLLPSAKNNGWPPQNVYWAGVLLMRDLDFWKKTTWTEEDVDLEKALWSFGTRDAIAKMHRGFLGDITTLFGTKQERERVLSIMKYLFKNGAIPDRMALLAVGDGFELADGHHRYLALIQAKSILTAIENYKNAGKEGELESFYKTLADKWGIKEIAPLSAVHTVWVARPD